MNSMTCTLSILISVLLKKFMMISLLTDILVIIP